MTDEFLTKGLQKNRYIKSVQLADQFETEIIRELRRYGDRIVNENPELFETGAEGNKRISSNPGSALGSARLDYRMNRVRGPDDDSTQKLNIHLYWVEPQQYNRSDIDGGVLRGFGYKIKKANPEAEERVVTETRDWDLHTAENPFRASRIVFYRHVSSADDLHQTGELLVEHFSTFGSEYGVAKN